MMIVLAILAAALTAPVTPPAFSIDPIHPEDIPQTGCYSNYRRHGDVIPPGRAVPYDVFDTDRKSAYIKINGDIHVLPKPAKQLSDGSYVFSEGTDLSVDVQDENTGYEQYFTDAGLITVNDSKLIVTYKGQQQTLETSVERFCHNG